MPVALAVGIVGLVVFGWPLAHPQALADATPDDEARQVRELAQRLLSFGPRVPGEEAVTVDLLPGQLPEGLPVDLPVPPGGRIVGSAARHRGGEFIGATVVLDLPVSDPAAGGAEAVAFVQQALEQQGWRPASAGRPHGGFQPPVVAGGLFCQGEAGPWFLNLSAFQGTAGTADVRVYVEKDLVHGGPCARRLELEPRVPPGSDRIPPLYAPAGVSLEGVGGGGSGNQWRSEATARTTMPVAELEAHFARQLQAAGWVRQAGGADGPLAWSLWAVPGEGEWRGFLYALEGPGDGRRSLLVEVAAGDPSAAGGGGAAGAGMTTAAPSKVPLR
ncbi:MAG: hypothetical protein IRY95_08985 [Clostridia bacterium]|nr:hypothetical protein [Clostridia bacterium]